MVGEIATWETAEIASRLAQTWPHGALYLHTNSAAETLTRLRNIGVPSLST